MQHINFIEKHYFPRSWLHFRIWMQCIKLPWMLRLLTKGSRDTKNKVLFQSSTNKLIFALARLILKTRKVYLRIKSAVSPETNFFISGEKWTAAQHQVIGYSRVCWGIYTTSVIRIQTSVLPLCVVSCPPNRKVSTSSFISRSLRPLPSSSW